MVALLRILIPATGQVQEIQLLWTMAIATNNHRYRGGCGSATGKCIKYIALCGVTTNDKLNVLSKMAVYFSHIDSHHKNNKSFRLINLTQISEFDYKIMIAKVQSN